MTISLLHIVVPTLLVLVVLILYINASKKQMINEIRELKMQLEKLENVSELAVKAAPYAERKAEVEPAEQIAVKDEKKDGPDELAPEDGASEYNTGKSGKTYTKEELESLIKE